MCSQDCFSLNRIESLPQPTASEMYLIIFGALQTKPKPHPYRILKKLS